MEHKKNRKRLPFGDPSFREIREGDFLYADKTEYIYDMIKFSKYYFLSRPRRFGKTLLIDTVDELFRGDRKLFDGLWIDAESDYGFEKHPVLSFNMAYTEVDTQGDLSDRIKSDIRYAASEEGIKISDESLGEMLGQLLQGLYRKCSLGAVILVDESDAPVTDHMSDIELASECQKVLHDFYRSMKKNFKNIHFALVTGITRFAMAALDSGPDNFKDISLLSDFAGICGFTVSDLDKLFKDRYDDTLERLKADKSIVWNAKHAGLKAKILQWYDGYDWLGEEHVLNPYSILIFFYAMKLESYWPLSGQPSHLSTLARNNPLEFIQPKLDGHKADEIRKSELTQLKAVPFLFHSGYLTIDRIITREKVIDNKITQIKEYSFRIPNIEIALDYDSTIFMNAFAPNGKYLSDLTENLPDAMVDKNSSEVEMLLHNLLSSISSDQHMMSAQLCHAVLHGSLLAAGFDVLSQASAVHGRSYIVLSLNHKVRVVIELKYCCTDRNVVEGRDGGKASRDGNVAKGLKEKGRAERELSASLDEGEKAIRVKDYAGLYRAARYAVICLAVAIRGRDEVGARFVDP
ncbi:MAG: AAA family ATPase [Deltaproteobacteria bacterium]|jgi:hypothetical protein|nr:AAA family ATPase [Deltaproteobacteria bacterium]